MDITIANFSPFHTSFLILLTVLHGEAFEFDVLTLVHFSFHLFCFRNYSKNVQARFYRTDEREWKFTSVNSKPSCGQTQGRMGTSDVLTGEHPADVPTGPTSTPHKTQKAGEGCKSVVGGVSRAEVIRHPCLQGTVPRYP